MSKTFVSYGLFYPFYFLFCECFEAKQDKFEGFGSTLFLNSRQIVSTLQDELDHTKANAHLLLLDQNTEISQTIQRLDALSELVCHLDQQIEENVTEWSTVRIHFYWSESNLFL